MNRQAIAIATSMAAKMTASIRPQEGPEPRFSGESCMDSVYVPKDAPKSDKRAAVNACYSSSNTNSAVWCLTD